MSTPTNTALIERFYAAFAALDGAAMQACYAEDASFADPVFTLQGRAQVGGMWRMLCAATREKGRDVWKLKLGDISADGSTGRAHWEAHYRFGATGKMVHNIIDAQFVFRDGLIARHTDHFDFWRWSRQALGVPGTLLGWSPLLRNQVRTKAAGNLAAFMSRQP
ncbi:MAG: nuclear transport factor 2 family protein [Burkholderiaceae bacterium]